MSGTIAAYSQTSEGLASERATRALSRPGVARAVARSPAWDLDRLRAAAAGKITLPNPGGSIGCAPVLRELLTQSGLVHAVDVELALDADPLGHQGGNALDVRGLTDEQTKLIADLFLRLAPLFLVVCYMPADGIPTLVWNGADASDAPSPALSAFATRCTGHVHAGSSLAQLAHGLGLPADDPTSPAGYIAPPADSGYRLVSDGILDDRVFIPPVGAGDASIDARQEVT